MTAAAMYGLVAPGVPAAIGGAPAGEPAATAPSGGGRLPRPGWPKKADLDYVKTAVEVFLLLLAVPWLLAQLARRPGHVAKQAARKHVPSA